ncbi:TPA: hypothetical protein DEP21_00545, partial [Patescibacteria group bacterium]|nr:hypothetical protein [Candidatus Gracilibacteria bacterium]
GKLTFSHPDIVPTTEPENTTEDEDSTETNETPTQSNNTYNVGRIFPIYPELNGIKPGRFAQKIWSIIDKVDTIFIEYLPSEFLKKFNLL